MHQAVATLRLFLVRHMSARVYQQIPHTLQISRSHLEPALELVDLQIILDLPPIACLLTTMLRPPL